MVLEEDEKAVLREILCEGVKRGIFDIDDVDVLSMAIVSVLNEVVLREFPEGGFDKRKHMAKTMTKYLINGILKR